MKTIDYWYDFIKGEEKSGNVFNSLSKELPSLVSLIMDRNCRFNCSHCIFPKNESKTSLEKSDSIIKILKQLNKPKVIHEGRQLTVEQIPFLKIISEEFKIGLIDSGTYLNIINSIIESKLKFDWLDISIDGPEKIHNKQRRSTESFNIALSGIKNANKILKQANKISSLTTLSKINFESILDTSEIIETLGINNWHVTTMSTRNGLEHLKTSCIDLEKSVEQILKTDKKPILKIYDLTDMDYLIKIFGNKIIRNAYNNALVTQNSIVLNLGFPAYYFPESIAANETLVIDSDNWWRFPYCIKYTLDELKNGFHKKEDISYFNICKVTDFVRVKQEYRRATNNWISLFGEEQLNKEKEIFNKIF